MVPPSHNRLSCGMREGFGDMSMQDLVAWDLRNGYISEASAKDVYGLSQVEIDVAVSTP